MRRRSILIKSMINEDIKDEDEDEDSDREEDEDEDSDLEDEGTENEDIEIHCCSVQFIARNLTESLVTESNLKISPSTNRLDGGTKLDFTQSAGRGPGSSMSLVKIASWLITRNWCDRFKDR